MIADDYAVLVAHLDAACASVAEAKRPAYTLGSVDVLANFKRVADRAGMTPEQVLTVYLLKHVDAITAMLTRPAVAQAEPTIGRFADAINYLRLGYALLVERETPDVMEPR